MIISERVDKEKADFEILLHDSCSLIEKEALSNPSYFTKRSSSDFEVDVHAAMCESAIGTAFHKTIHLISGHKFPDIVAKRFYGVEVKTTKQDHWKSTGNSVLESSRVEDVDRIYIFFGKLSKPLGFKYRLYEECLYDVAVTHSPRYLIDMSLMKGQSIFDKLKISYDDLRNRQNPIKPIINYYRKTAKKGEEPWWMDSGEAPEIIIKPTVRLWGSLDRIERDSLRLEAMARFPEIFGRSSTKYQTLATWLAARHGIVDSSLRDRFTAGGKINLVVNGKKYDKLPRIFQHLNENSKDVIEIVKRLPADDAKYHWRLRRKPIYHEKLDVWSKHVISYSSEILYDAREFIVNLLGTAFGQDESPPSVREEMIKYGLTK
jgi:hypothetical protein